MSRRVAWLQLQAGVAGDMLLGALLDAGAPLEEVCSQLDRLGLPGWSLRSERVQRGGLAATRAVVEVHDDAHERRHGEIAALVAGAGLEARVTARSLAAFAAMAEVEAELHGTTVEEVHLHELGGHDAIVDVVGTMAALEALGIDRLRTTAIGVGRGAVQSAHGLLPGPAPASARLLEGRSVLPLDDELETATPTGLAIVASLAEAEYPPSPLRVLAHGLGAGSREIPGRANVVGVLIGEEEPATSAGVVLLETNLDDVTGEQLGVAIAELMALGALDAWVAPITMKKGRPGHLLSVLAAPADAERLSLAVVESTGSLGVRRSALERSVLDRHEEVVDVDGHRVRFKVSAVRAKPEHDDLLALAKGTGRSLRAAEAMAHEARGGA